MNSQFDLQRQLSAFGRFFVLFPLVIFGCSATENVESKSKTALNGTSVEWIATRQLDNGVVVKLGYVSTELSPGGKVQPAAHITQNGEFIRLAGIMVREEHTAPNSDMYGGIPLNLERTDDDIPSHFEVIPRMALTIPEDASDTFNIEFEIRVDQSKSETVVELLELRLG